MPKLKPEELQQRRQEIIDAARRCFVRSGFHQTTTDEICHEASITPGGLYHYFANKEDVVKAVVQDASTQAVEMMRSTAAQTDPRSALRSVGDFFFRAMHEPGFEDIAKLDLEAWSQSLRNPELLEMVREARKAVREAVSEVIRAAIARGDYSEQVDANGLASLFMAIFTGLRLNLLLTPEDVDAMAVLDALRLMIRGELPGPKAPERQRLAALRPPLAVDTHRA